MYLIINLSIILSKLSQSVHLHISNTEHHTCKTLLCVRHGSSSLQITTFIGMEILLPFCCTSSFSNSDTFQSCRSQLVNCVANNKCKVISPIPCVQRSRIMIISFDNVIIPILLYIFLKCITKIYITKIYITKYVTYCLKLLHDNSTSTCNPLTTTDYKWVTWRKKSKYSYLVYPVHTFINGQLPFSNLNNNELINAVLTRDSIKDNLDGVLNDHNIDYSTLGGIDPDTHFLSANKHLKSHYHTETEFNKLVELDKKFTLFNVNIRSIPKNFDRLRHYLYELNHNFSVLSITESWLKQYNRTTYNLKGYTHVSKIREDRPGGGVSLFVKKELRYELKEDIILDLPDVDTIAIEISNKDLNSLRNVIVLAIYRPPDISPKLFIEKLSLLLQQLHQENKQVFLMGDFNINISEALVTTDKTVNEFYNTFLSFYFYPLINQPTRVYGESKSIIDNIFTNSPNIIRSGILKTDFSDHYSLFCITDLNGRVIKTKEVTKRELSAPNFKKCSEILKTTDWDPVYKLVNFEQSFKFFHDTILTILDHQGISLLPTISKIFERILYNQLYEYFDNNHLLAEQQYGFRSNHSTEYAAVKLVDHISKEMESGNTPAALYIDLSKAFDTLSFDILLYKLNHYGIKDNAFKLLKSYLTDRQQFAVFNNHNSQTSIIKTGVPQGSILGPLFFSICINDLITVSDKLKFIMYADDTTIYFNLEDFDRYNLEQDITNELENITLWLKRNKVSLNVQKTKLMIFHRKQKQINELNILIDGIAIERVESFNFLGLIIDEGLSWKKHTDVVKNEISKVVGILYRLNNIFPKNVLQTLYNSLIASYINYGLLLWGVESNRIELLQKKAIRLITNSNYNAHTTPLFIKLGLLKIQDMFKLKLLKFYYKLSSNLLPKYFESYRDVIERAPVRELRQHYIHPPLIRRVYAECSPLFQLIELINTLKADKNDTILEKN